MCKSTQISSAVSLFVWWKRFNSSEDVALEGNTVFPLRSTYFLLLLNFLSEHDLACYKPIFFSRALLLSYAAVRRCSVEEAALEIFGKFTGKHFSNVGNHTEVRLHHRCSPVNFPKIFKRAFLQNTSGWLLLPSQRKSLLTLAKIKNYL